MTRVIIGLIGVVLCLTGCSKHTDLKDSKQLQWRVECQKMLLKGAEALLNHHDCHNRCIQHYAAYCTNRCETAMREGQANKKEVDSTCRVYLKKYIPKKCHHICDLSPTELKEYQTASLQDMQEELLGKSSCRKEGSSFKSLDSNSSFNIADDNINPFRNSLRGSSKDELPWKQGSSQNPNFENSPGQFFGPAGASAMTATSLGWKKLPKRQAQQSKDDGDDLDEDNDEASALSQDDPEDDDDTSSFSSDDDQSSETASSQDNMGQFLQGYRPYKKFSIQGDENTINALSDQLNAASPPPQNSGASGIHTLETEIVNARDTVQAVKDIGSLLKGFKN